MRKLIFAALIVKLAFANAAASDDMALCFLKVIADPLAPQPAVGLAGHCSIGNFTYTIMPTAVGSPRVSDTPIIAGARLLFAAQGLHGAPMARTVVVNRSAFPLPELIVCRVVNSAIACR